MIVYRSQERVAQTASLLAEIRNSDDARDRLIRFGELEAGVIDALMPDRDGDSPLIQPLRTAAIAIARGDQPAAALDTLHLPNEIRISVPEGYAFYALYPESYQAAARQFAGAGYPKNVCVIGIRSIGTSLSTVVAASLEESGFTTRSWTVRPHGHPFDRRLALTPELERTWRRCASTHAFAIVDEGPGLSGSSFIAVASKLRELGVSEQRIALFPSWEGNPASFVNERARTEWPRYRKFCAPFQRSWIGAGALTDLSAGEWRRLVYSNPSEWPAVQPQHEARKYLDEDGTLYKFAGLGPYGREKWIRACLLSEAGFGPRVYGLRNGFLERQFVRARPVNPKAADASLLDAIARYASYRNRLFPGTRSVDFDSMLHMIEVNSRESGMPVDPALQRQRAPFENRPAAAVDGRMMPHEWLATAGGWMKADAVDHCCDHFFPGFADIAWDLAAARVEFRLTPAQSTYLLSRYAAASRDRIPPALMKFYETAYVAFRIGYANMAANNLKGTADGDRFRAMEAELSNQIHPWQASQ